MILFLSILLSLLFITYLIVNDLARFTAALIYILYFGSLLLNIEIQSIVGLITVLLSVFAVDKQIRKFCIWNFDENNTQNKQYETNTIS